ncbi:unnamed protein product, partial [Symbiodinium sp. CCMP2456]
IVDHMLGLMARCAGSKGNECESLHKLIHNNGKALPVTVGTVDTRVLVLTGKPRVETVGWPVLFLSAWAQQLFSTGGKVLLGGHTLDNPRRFRKMFTTFWDRFQHVRPDLDIYRRTDRDMGMCIPIALHGDEGRGKLRRPVMVLSFQPIISHKGPHFINSSGHSFTTRLLYTLIPSQVYYKRHTLDMLHQGMVDDMLALYNDGFTVEWKAHSYKFYFIPVYLKGDWPYIRSAAHLMTGFSSRKKCHLCPAAVLIPFSVACSESCKFYKFNLLAIGNLEATSDAGLVQRGANFLHQNISKGRRSWRCV